MDYSKPKKCRCGTMPKVASYERSGDEWFYIICPECGMKNDMHYNLLEYSVVDWNNDKVELGAADGMFDGVIMRGIL